MDFSTTPSRARRARRAAEGKHDVLLNTTSAWSKRFQREIHRGGKWKTRPALAASMADSENALPNTRNAVPSTLYYRFGPGDGVLGTFDQNILNSTLLAAKRRGGDHADPAGEGDKVLTLNRRIKPLTAVLEEPTVESKASVYDPPSATTSTFSRDDAAAAAAVVVDKTVLGTGEIFKSEAYATSSLLVFRIKNFFVAQVDPSDQQKTGRAFDLLYNLGIALRNEQFHDRMGDASGWRHAVLAGIVPRSLLHATAINGHLYGILLQMLHPFCDCRSWADPVAMKALGALFFFLNQRHYGGKSSTTMGDADADVDAYDMAMLNRLPLHVIMYFLNFITAQHYSIRLEKQLSLIYANRVGGRAPPNNGAPKPSTGELLSVFFRGSSPTSQGIMYYYALESIAQEEVLKTRGGGQSKAGIKRNIIVELANSGFVVALHNYMLAKAHPVETSAIAQQENRMHGLLNAYLFGSKANAGGKPIIHKRTNIDIYIHKVVRYKKVKIDVARDILRFVQKIMITVNEFLDQARLQKQERSTLSHAKIKLLVAGEKDSHDASDVTLAKNIEEEFEKVAAKMAGGVEKDTPHLLLRAVFGRKSLTHLKHGDKDEYLKIVKEAIEIAREHNQDVVDTAVELLLKQSKAEKQA